MQCIAFRLKMKMMKSLFLHFYVYLVVSLIFDVFFCVESLPKPTASQNCPPGQPTKPGKYYQQEPKILTKRPEVTTVPFGMNTVIWALVYQGISL